MLKQPVMLKNVPVEERPRERLIKYGESHLSNQEILALLLGSGTRKESVMDLSNRVLMHFEGLKLLSEATIEELTAIKRSEERRVGKEWKYRLSKRDEKDTR